MVNTPILLIVFNRIDTLSSVLSAIREAAPSRLFIAADGSRPSRAGEKEKCAQVREYVLASIDWPCEVKTLFRDNNLGCGKAVSSAISWFFSQVEEGIILEDDCVPSSSFFAYCEDLLARYRNIPQIMHIAGHDPLNNKNAKKESYYFSRIQHCWGWATWKRAWEHYSFDITDLNKFIESSVLDRIFRRKISKKYWIDIFHKMEQHEIDTWDYQWTYSILKSDGLCINPTVNLVSNIGFGGGGTHTFDSNSPYSNQKAFEINKLDHPTCIEINMKLVEKINKVAFGLRYDPIGRVIRGLKSIIKRAIGIRK